MASSMIWPIIPTYTKNHAPDDSCVIKLAFLVTWDVKVFRTQVLWYTLVVYGQNYSGSTGPVGVVADGEITCFSDEAGREKGWSMYTDMMTPAPTPLPTPCTTSHTMVSYDECDVVVIVSKPKLSLRLGVKSGL